MPDVYLNDSRVEPVKERIYARFPALFEAGTELVTIRHEPPFTGQLPDGQMGTAGAPVLQFLLVSPHPRPVQRRMGVQHVSVATLWERGWEDAEREHRGGHYNGQGHTDPLEVIFMGLALKHNEDLASLKQIMN
jgi:hypothetical protein